MHVKLHLAYRWLNISAFLGSVLSVVALVRIQADISSFLAQAEFLMFFGVGVVTPVSLRLAAQPDRNDNLPAIFALIVRLQPVVVLATGLALFGAPSWQTAVSASLWLFQGILIGFYGLYRLLSRSTIALEELCIDVGLLYTPISGVWLVAYSAGYPLLTFDPVFVLLTAIHFVYITLGALVIAGMIGRRLHGSPHWKVYRVSAALIILGLGLIALAISTTQLTGRLAIEAVSVLIFASSFILFAALCLFNALPKQVGARSLMLVAGTALFTTMILALAYSLGRGTGWWALSIPSMIHWHGWINAFGFVLPGIVAWSLETPSSNVQPSGIPFSHLPWRWTIRPDYFLRTKTIETNPHPVPTGIVDRIGLYGREDFSPDRLPPEIVAFYEHTDSHALLVHPEWQRGFRTLARIYKRLSTIIQQMNFPLTPDSRETEITSTIVSIHDALDGRENVRGWIRVYARTQHAVYVAAYSSHTYRGETYMNIAFPLPFGNLTSILRLNNMKMPPDGLSLTSFSTRTGDQGVFFATKLLAMRLPVNEIIDVFPHGMVYEGFPANFVEGVIVARHKMWLFGRHCLTLHYSITPCQTANSLTR